MRRAIVTAMAILLTFMSVNGQKVGLVLSGGGAKGVAHIGLIKAMEEHDIPIDYVVGTSIGAIIGSMYAMGYSTDEMVNLIMSEEFSRWYSGEDDSRYRFYFKQNDPTPSLGTLHFDLHDSLLVVRPQSTSIVNPNQMNLAFVNLFSSAGAACGGDFDKLMVPFRCIGADVYNKRRIVMSHGDLGNSVRASMTFPFVFKPISIDGVIVYDGGIYDNFPYDVMIDEFHPDFIVGSIVSGPDSIPDADNLYGQLRSMIIQENDEDYVMPAENGIAVDMNLDDVRLLDFQRADELVKRGYEYAMGYIDSITSCIKSRRSLDVVRKRREEFKSEMPEMVFRNIIVDGVSEHQAEFLEREFRQDNASGEKFGFEELKRGYFRLLSDNGVKDIVPKASYNHADSTFSLILDVDLDDKMMLHLGGGLSTSSTSQLYAGISYKSVGNYSVDYLLDGQVGRAYNDAQFTIRLDMAKKTSKALSMKLAFSNFNFYNQKYIFTNSDNPAFNKDNELFLKLKATWPFLNESKAELSFGGALHNDYYTNSKNISNFKYDITRSQMLGASAKFIANTLNALQYPTQGYTAYIQGDIYTSRDKYMPRSISDESTYTNKSWLQMTVLADVYTKVSPKLTLGNYMKLYYSTRGLCDSYQATMMQAGRFEPTVNSLFIYNNDFRANKYVAYGFKPIYNLNRFFHLRGEFYGFLPFFPICSDANSKPYRGEAFSEISFLGEVSLVAKYERVSANVFLNINGKSGRWESPTFGITIGYLMPGERFIE